MTPPNISLLIFTVLWGIIIFSLLVSFYYKKLFIEFCLLLSITVIGGILYTILLINNQQKDQQTIDEDFNQRLLRIEALLPMSS
jgi:hypothetical protein